MALVSSAGPGAPFLTGVQSFREKSVYFSRADYLCPAPEHVSQIQKRTVRVSAGVGLTGLQSLQRCLGEAAERYSVTFQETDICVMASWNDLGDYRCPYELLRPFSEAQYRNRKNWNAGIWGFPQIPAPLPPTSVIKWSPMQSLVDKRIVLLPTEMLYLGAGTDGQQMHFVSDTMGCAAGKTLEDAVLSALLECVERDAVAIWWYNRISRTAASPGLLRTDAARPWIRYLDAIGRMFHISEITTDLGIPVYAAVSHNEDGSTIALGFGCHPDRPTAVAKALRELCQTSRGTVDSDPTDYTRGTMQYAWLRWALRANIRNEQHLVPGAAPATVARPLRATESVLSDCVNRLMEMGYDPLAMVATRPEIGWPTARVQCPGLCHSWHRLGISRLTDAPVAMGLRSRKLTERQLNPTPFTL